ncbi:Rrf2 family transcriptional regulator [Paenibacillus sp. Leaf72]|uniref:Rrf2 family transcriptional regulator n=1 Tax=Paenibacillus sp. Leaf72 TaxID=1736234 RepID=UPI0006F894E7|nr:Rrf2 family transcriptional regulator [Paenibacillus sp. Leaf72]KQO16675.1 Rrf2 family transcriptional regulator [Paenibacillus sp. Leaf72]
MKQLSSRFSMGVHILTLIAVMPGDCTGDIIAGSVNTNPVVIRRIMAQLKKARLISVRPGVGGATLLKDPASISLLEVYHAVEVIDEGPLFNFHQNSSPRCPVGRTIEASLTAELAEAQAAMEQKLSSVSIAKMMGQVG